MSTFWGILLLLGAIGWVIAAKRDFTKSMQASDRALDTGNSDEQDVYETRAVVFGMKMCLDLAIASYLAVAAYGYLT
jgi:hypothetical protein